MTVVCRSVCLSVSLVLDSMSRTEGHSKLKIGRREAHDTGNPWLHLEVKRSKVKVSIGRLTLRRKMHHVFGTGRPTNFNLGSRMEYDDPRHRRAQWPQRSKIKDITSRHQFDACLPVTRQRKVAEAPKLAGRLSVPRVTLYTPSRSKGQRSGSPDE